jgi:hypothetical protein
MLLAAVIALVLATGVFAQAFSVDYLDGTVELKIPKDTAGRLWKALVIGDSVATDASLRLGPSSSVELTRGRTRITILKPGIYMVADLSKAKEKASVAAIGPALTQKLTALTTEKAPTSSAVGGTRGTEQGTSTGSVMWIEENDEVRTKVAEYMAGGKYKDAVAELTKAIPDAATDQEEAELQYLLAAAYYGDGETLRAYRTVTKLPTDTEAAYYPRDVLLKAQILVDSLDFGEALALLKPVIAAGQTGETAQMAYLLAGVSQKGMGDLASAKASFNAGYAIDPSTATATLIGRQLGK